MEIRAVLLEMGFTAHTMTWNHPLANGYPPPGSHVCIKSYSLFG
jgi:hypothetical protein